MRKGVVGKLVLVQIWSTTASPAKHEALSDASVRLLRDHNNHTCTRSPCCSEYVMTWMEAGPLALYPHWAKVQTVRSVLLERRTNVVFLDMDAFLLDVHFCPQWTGDGDSFDKALLIAPDPKPWQQPLNAGFFAVRHNDIGVAIMDAWWQAYETNISSCWAEGATCGMCRRNFTSCIKPCIYGGYCSDQFTLKEAVWPRFQRHFLILPRTFQDTGLGCNGTVKHFAAGFNRRQVVRVLSKCGGSREGADRGGSERPSLPSLRQRRVDAIDAMLAGTTLQQAHTLIDAAVATSDGPTAAAPTAAAPSRKRPPPAAASSSYLVDWRVRHIHVLSFRGARIGGNSYERRRLFSSGATHVCGRIRLWHAPSACPLELRPPLVATGTLGGDRARCVPVLDHRGRHRDDACAAAVVHAPCAGVARFTKGRRVHRARIQSQLQFQRPL